MPYLELVDLAVIVGVRSLGQAMVEENRLIVNARRPPPMTHRKISLLRGQRRELRVTRMHHQITHLKNGQVRINDRIAQPPSASGDSP